jgi:hypothetical protein
MVKANANTEYKQNVFKMVSGNDIQRFQSEMS